MIHSDQMNDLQLEDVEDYSADYPPVGGEANMAPMANSDEMTGNKSPKYRRAAVQALVRNNKWTVGLLAVVVIVLIGIMAAAVGKDEAKSGAGDSAEAGVPPKIIDPASVDQDVLANFKATIEGVYSRHSLSTDALQDPNTSASKAMVWMATDRNVNSIEHTEQLQRYVLGVLFYATNQVSNDYAKDPLPWLKADKWMTTAHSCDWMGIVCNKDKVIVSIDLERNRLSGKLPQELAIIGSHLETLDLTSNLIHMTALDDYNMFKSFTSMKTLLMDDNYLSHKDTGLPDQFRHMTNLQKMRLSYNLFEGQLESGHNPVLGALPKLTHLEIESNFLTGTMPAAIGNLNKLVYLYMRRNDMSFNLNFLKTGQLTDLCMYAYTCFYFVNYSLKS
jgi:hypothetical protein